MFSIILAVLAVIALLVSTVAIFLENYEVSVWALVAAFILGAGVEIIRVAEWKLNKCSDDGLTFVRVNPYSEWSLLIEDGNPVLCKNER